MSEITRLLGYADDSTPSPTIDYVIDFIRGKRLAEQENAAEAILERFYKGLNKKPPKRILLPLDRLLDARIWKRSSAVFSFARQPPPESDRQPRLITTIFCHGSPGQRPVKIPLRMLYGSIFEH